MSREGSGFIQALLSEGYPITKVATGDSMLPTIPSKAVLNIEPVGYLPARLGDIVLILSQDGNTKIHRVSLLFRRNAGMWLQTWGDNCQVPDAPVPLDKVLGRVVAVQVGDGWCPVRNRWKSYVKFFLLRYGRYYLKKALTRVTS
jgi:hypothetical protein